MEQLISAIHKWDPHYKDKVKLVVGVIQHELSKQRQFPIADVNRHLDFKCDRYIRLLCRSGFLKA